MFWRARFLKGLRLNTPAEEEGNEAEGAIPEQEGEESNTIMEWKRIICRGFCFRMITLNILEYVRLFACPLGRQRGFRVILTKPKRGGNQ